MRIRFRYEPVEDEIAGASDGLTRRSEYSEEIESTVLSVLVKGTLALAKCTVGLNRV